MKYGLGLVLGLFVAFGLMLGAVSAAYARNFDTAPAVQQAQYYLNNLERAQAKFIQTAADGTQLSGTFYLNRPGRLRFEYDDLDDFIVADGFFIYFYDSTLQEQTNAPIGQTLADFILRDKLSFTGDLQVTDLRRAGDLLQIRVVQRADPAAGSITLGFAENPMTLKKWRVDDAAGNVTEIELFNMNTNVNFPRDLFIYADPKRIEDRKRFNE